MQSRAFPTCPKLPVNHAYPAPADPVLRDVLARDPEASLEEIRAAHPSLRRLSLDHLGLLLARLLERRAVRSLK
jgi:hypothetical protein